MVNRCLSSEYGEEMGAIQMELYICCRVCIRLRVSVLTNSVTNRHKKRHIILMSECITPKKWLYLALNSNTRLMLHVKMIYYITEGLVYLAQPK